MKKENCKHRGYWFEVRFLFWRKKYLWCDKCLDAIKEKNVFANADLLCRREDGYFMSSDEKLIN
jgi:hypothetical protein